MKTTKADCAREPFTFDWTAFYATFGLDPLVDLITSSTWSLTGGGTLGAENVATPDTSVFVEGGIAGNELVLENTIQVNNGEYQDCQKLFIEVI